MLYLKCILTLLLSNILFSIIIVSLFYLRKYSSFSLFYSGNVYILLGWHSVHSAVFVIYELLILTCTKKNPPHEKLIWNCLICPDECANYFREADLLSPFIVESNTLMAGSTAIEINTVIA